MKPTKIIPALFLALLTACAVWFPRALAEEGVPSPVIPPHTHTGGVATCSARAICALCGARYGEVNPNNHS